MTAYHARHASSWDPSCVDCRRSVDPGLDLTDGTTAWLARLIPAALVLALLLVLVLLRKGTEGER